MTLTTDDLQTYKSALNAERRRILINVDGLRDELGVSLTDETEENGLETHIGDQGTMTFLRERDLTLDELEEGILLDIDAALERIRQGSYGICTSCKQPIAAERLEALPWAERCIDCQEQ
jgi:RNA polymerase-binding protein DksA